MGVKAPTMVGPDVENVIGGFKDGEQEMPTESQFERMKEMLAVDAKKKEDKRLAQQ